MEFGRLHTSRNNFRVLHSRGNVLEISVGWGIQEILVQICWGSISIHFEGLEKCYKKILERVFWKLYYEDGKLMDLSMSNCGRWSWCCWTSAFCCQSVCLQACQDQCRVIDCRNLWRKVYSDQGSYIRKSPLPVPVSKHTACQNMQFIIVTYSCACDYRQVLDWWPDSLHTYTTRYYTSEITIWHIISSQSVIVFINLFLATASAEEDFSALSTDN
jgi:hypothetical protein